MLEPGLELAEVTRTRTRTLTRTLTQARTRTLTLARALARTLSLTLTLTLGGSGLAAGRLVWFTPPHSLCRARARARVRLVSLTGTVTTPYLHALRYDVTPSTETVMPEPVPGSEPRPAG